MAQSKGEIGFIDTTIRDGNQSLWDATGLTTAMILSIAPTMDRAGFDPPLTEDIVNDVIAKVRNSRHKRWSFAIPKMEISTSGLDLRERW